MSDLHKIAAAMGGEVHGRVASFPTPGHKKTDRGSWASLVPGAPDGVLIHSENGGDPLAIKDELRDKGVLPPRSAPERARDVAAWEYTDANGVTLYRKVRMALPNGGKSYRFEHPNGRGGWSKGRGDAMQVPYRLPDLIAAPAGAIVYMAEGEKQADKLASWGLVATSSKDWRGFEFSGYVKGRSVVILPDNDDQGAKIAAEAKVAVERAEGRAVLLDLPGLRPKGDVMDWSGTIDDLAALTIAALAPAPAKLLQMLDPADWQGEEAPSREWALEDWIPGRQATYLTGPGSAGKSLLSQLLCTCIALGLPFMGIETKQAVAIYITCEDDETELHRRQAAICAGLGVPLSALRGKLRLVSLMGEIGNDPASFDQAGRMSATARFGEIEATVQAIGAKFIALDNVAHFTPEEIARSKVAAFVNLLNRLARDCDGAVLFLGHPNKNGDPYSGSTAWENQVRSRLFLETPSDDDGEAADPDARVLSRGKANYARNGATVGFRWHAGTFSRDEDLPANIATGIAATVEATTANERFMACLAERGRQRRAVSEKVCKSYAPTVFSRMPEAKGLSKRAFESAMDRLFRLGRIERAELWTGDDRKPVYGLRATENVREIPAGNAREMSAGDRRECAGISAGNSGSHTPIPKGISGAATRAAAPSLEEGRPDFSRVVFPVEAPRSRGMILALEDIADGGSGGLGDWPS